MGTLDRSLTTALTCSVMVALCTVPDVTYHDRFVRTNQGWRFVSRSFDLLFVRQDP